jgi:hypothetical protein
MAKQKVEYANAGGLFQRATTEFRLSLSKLIRENRRES